MLHALLAKIHQFRDRVIPSTDPIMGFDIFVDPLQGAVFLICILGVPITTGATLRRFQGTKSSGRRIGWENWFALLALLSFWVHAATALWSQCTNQKHHTSRLETDTFSGCNFEWKRTF